MSLFFYTFKAKNTETEEEKEFVGAFNTDLIKMVHQHDVDSLIITLNDGHEESQVVGRNKDNSLQRMRMYECTQIELKGEDKDRFLKTYVEDLAIRTKIFN